jgi:PAT family beta-lactamase induction signal transducer AmpG
MVSTQGRGRIMSGELPTPPDAATRDPSRTSRMLAVLTQRRTLVMLALGFSSGLPFLMIGNTLGYWLRDGGVALAAIGFLSWAGLAYSFKFIWGAVVDRAPPPLLGGLGRRRGWMIWTQLGVAVGLIGMAINGPHGHAAGNLGWLAAMAIVTGVSAASQDVVIDAWRIEVAADADELGLLTSAYSLAFRIAIIATDAWILWLVTLAGWSWAYAAIGLLMGVGILGALFAPEPERVDVAIEAKTAAAPAFSARGVYDVVLEPFVAFFRTHGWVAALILLTITTYHLCDYLRGPVVNPYYVDLHIPKTVVAGVRTTLGLAGVFLGTLAGGLFCLRFGYTRALIVGGIIQPIAIAAFALLAYFGPDPRLFAAIMTFDGFAMAFAGVVLITYMSTLTTLGYTATQYALLSSALAVTGKFLKGFSGAWVQGLATGGRDLVHAYALFYLYAAAVGVPALGLVLWLAVWQRRNLRASEPRPTLH